MEMRKRRTRRLLGILLCFLLLSNTMLTFAEGISSSSGWLDLDAHHHEDHELAVHADHHAEDDDDSDHRTRRSVL